MVIFILGFSPNYQKISNTLKALCFSNTHVFALTKIAINLLS